MHLESGKELSMLRIPCFVFCKNFQKFDCVDKVDKVDTLFRSFYIFLYLKIPSYFKLFQAFFQEIPRWPKSARWVGTSHSDFVIEHPSETELPWQDMRFMSYLCHIYVITSHMLGIFGDPYWNLKMPTTLWKNELWALSSRDFLGWISIDIVWYGMILYDIVWYCIAFPWNLVPQGFPWGSPRSIFWPRTLVVFAFWTTPSIRTPVNS